MRKRSVFTPLLAIALLSLGGCAPAAAPTPTTPPGKPAAPTQPAAQAPAKPTEAAKPAEDVAAFYRGKTLSIIVGYSAGGGYDLYARVLAEHMKKYIPGNPNIIVQNMPGGGSLVAANHLFNSAPKDGTVFGIVGRGVAQSELAGAEGVQFRAREFNWLGSMNEEVSVCVSRVDSGVSKFEDLYTRTLRVGGTGPGADTDFFPLVLNAVLGTKFELIPGYPGGNEINLGMERGELQGRCGWSWSSVVSTRADWLKEPRFINVLIQMALNKHKDPQLRDVPLVLDLAKNQDDRALLELLFSRQTMGRPFMAPPGVPAARVQALRDAFMRTMEDKEFLEAAQKANLELNPASGQAVQQIVDKMFSTKPEIIERFKKVYREAGGGT